MDVVCERCETEYEFDETLLSPSGTAVRCGHCSFAFRVFPPAPVGGTWNVRRDDGLHVNLSSLTDLRARIRAGELGENDAISRDGSPWKLLGEIAELRSTFDAARTARKPRPSAPRPTPDAVATVPRARVQTRRDGWSSLPGAPSAPAAQTVEAPVAQPPAAQAPVVAPPQAAATPPQPSPQPAHPTPRPDPARAPIGATPTGRTPRPELRGPPTTGRAKPRLIVLALAEDELPPQRRDSRLGRLTLLVASVTAIALFFGIRSYRADAREALTTATRASVETFASDTYDVYRASTAALLERHAENPDSTGPVAGLSLGHARWAQALLDEAEFETDTARAESLRGLAREHAAEALRFGDSAVQLGPSDRAALTAAADAHRLAGEFDVARALLDRARDGSAPVEAETLRVAAALAADEREDDAAERADLERAIVLAPGDARLLVRRARLLITTRDRGAAASALDALTQAHRDHPAVRYLGAALLRLALDAGLPSPETR